MWLDTEFKKKQWSHRCLLWLCSESKLILRTEWEGIIWSKQCISWFLEDDKFVYFSIVCPILNETGSERLEEKKVTTSVTMLRWCNAPALSTGRVMKLSQHESGREERRGMWTVLRVFMWAWGRSYSSLFLVFLWSNRHGISWKQWEEWGLSIIFLKECPNGCYGEWEEGLRLSRIC